MIFLIVAYDKNLLIGNKGKMPWYIEGELKRLKRLTTGNVVIMGRKTYEAIGHPLSERINVVLTRSAIEGVETSSSLDEVLEKYKDRDIYILGGAAVYKEILDKVDIMYITKIDAEFEGDVYFPSFDESLFEIEIEEEHKDEDIPYTYLTYKRRS